MPITPIREDWSRQQEIHEWLKSEEATHVRAWVALDDLELVEGEGNAELATKFQSRAVRVEPSRGLTMQDAQLAVQLFRAQGCASNAKSQPDGVLQEGPIRRSTSHCSHK
eukprot:TRINITY_DN4760_c0_g1_i3.p1 TRINITY_DN4760_c0_g1~~TRINITY_DN4760_c0_g1_i3.p1  ORF type:complete len:110 (+),score=9.53 TRINITY_DN4760_c0_g1_i3:265-594(+)